MLNEPVLQQAASLIEHLRRAAIRVATAESCTGGLIAAALTHPAGASSVFDRGFVTYANAAKTALVGVPEAMLLAHGAVSEPVAAAMAEGALARSEAGLAIAVTGIAGPDGGTESKPVGLVWFGLAWRTGVRTERQIFPGTRAEVREATVVRALALLRAAAG